VAVVFIFCNVWIILDLVFMYCMFSFLSYCCSARTFSFSSCLHILFHDMLGKIARASCPGRTYTIVSCGAQFV